MTDKEIEKKALEIFGERAQMLKTCEECAELMDAIFKFLDGRGSVDHVREEIADVEIMLDQLKLAFIGSQKGWKTVKKWKKEKLERLAERTKNERSY